MCIRRCVLKIGEKIFHVLVLLGLIGGLASAINSGMMIGGRDGYISGGIQLIISWSGTLIIALIVYSLLDIHSSLCHSQNDCHNGDQKNSCGINDKEEKSSCHTD